MNKTDRKQFVNSFWPGLVLIVVTYLALTVVRDIRDNFEVEIWAKLGFDKQPAIFTQIDFPVALGVLAMMALLISVKNNIKAFACIHIIVLVGFVIVLVASILFSNQIIGPIVWMSLAAFGLYLSYVPFNSIFFERMIASFKIAGNVGFVMYLADSMGYFGSVSVLLIKQFGNLNMSWLVFYQNALYALSVIGIVGILFSLKYFLKKHSKTAWR
jgi:hypothetical protein